MGFLEIIWSTLQGPSSKIPVGCKASHEVRFNCSIRSCCAGPQVLKMSKDEDSTTSLGTYSNISLPQSEKKIKIKIFCNWRLRAKTKSLCKYSVCSSYVVLFTGGTNLMVKVCALILREGPFFL